jgi:hypothetical protein
MEVYSRRWPEAWKIPAAEPAKAGTAAALANLARNRDEHGRLRSTMVRARILSANPTISNRTVQIERMIEENALVRATNPAHPSGRGTGKQGLQTSFANLVMSIRTPK